jgi:hypothetical protein
VIGMSDEVEEMWMQNQLYLNAALASKFVKY